LKCNIEYEMLVDRRRFAVVSLLTLLCPWCVICEVKIIDNREIEAFGKAANTILESIPLHAKTVTILTYETEGNSGFFRNHIDAVVRHSKEETVFKVYDSKEVHKRPPCNGKCLILVDKHGTHQDLDLFGHFHGSRNNFYVIYVYQTSSKIFIENQSRLGGYYFYPKMYYIVHDHVDSIDLITLDDFSSTSCFSLQVSFVNRFSVKQMEWERPMQVLDKEIKLHGCAFEVRIIRGIVTEGVDVLEENNQVKLSGAMIDIFKAAAEIMNFTMTFGIDKDLNLEVDNHIYIITENLKEERVIESFISIIRLELLIIIPPGELYSEWEILGLAFDTATWILIGITFGGATTTIFIIKTFGSATVQNFVFGRNVSSPGLNVLIAFFGLSQGVLPRRNFSRFLLLLFIGWSLIIRTCYNSKLFEFLQSDQRKQEIQSIDEMLQHNFSYFTCEGHRQLISKDEEFYTKIRLNGFGWITEPAPSNHHEKPRDDRKANLKAYLESTIAESITFLDEFQVIDYNSKSHKPLRVMKERLRTFDVGISTAYYSYLDPTLRRIVTQFIESGILMHSISKWRDFNKLHMKEEEKEPEVLTLVQLAIGFKLYVICLIVAIAIFIAERLIARHNHRNQFGGYLD